uniref:NADH:ubiquinone reductase (H(+)-translocating) n=1 Tax=Colposcenia ignota TaxID=3230277 RepID=A0AAU8G642_9HEMI
MKSMSKFILITLTFILLIMLLGFFLCFFIFFDLNLFIELNFMDLNSIEFKFIVFIDWMSMVFSLIVLFISSMILLYSESYLGYSCLRFLWLTVFFVFFMLLMIFSPSILGVILGWDGLGLISYCLVIYYQSKSSFNSGFITAASNRLGDSFLILSIVISSFTNNFLFWEINSLSILMFLLACFTKSAQFPFSAWLPLAMAAPTPISSLVHSSTLVTAGVYMCIRFNYSLHSMNLSLIIFMISSFTIIMASLSSFFEYDLKRIIAFSTLSQLGFMMLILSMGYSFISFFHLLIHALFSALLFMCAGSYIYSGGSFQDLRKMGSMNINLMMKFSLMISSFSLAGVPFSSGFYSKDLMLEIVFMNWGGQGVGIFMLLCAFLTISYTFRILKWLNLNNFWVIWVEPPLQLIFPIMVISMLNIILGCSLNWLISEVKFICVSFDFKIMIMVILVISIFWQGEFYGSGKYYYFYSMFWIMSISKSMNKLIILIFFMMKSMDQGWMEYSLNYLKIYILSMSFWMMSVFFQNYAYLNSIWFFIYVVLIF